MYYISCLRERAKMNAEVSELADEQDKDLVSIALVWVQVPSSAVTFPDRKVKIT